MTSYDDDAAALLAATTAAAAAAMTYGDSPYNTNPNSSGSSTSNTYEAYKARQSTAYQPDPVVWDAASAFREEPYRQLHHQRGLMGLFRVRLLEASDLKRSYWSPLAVGPVKLLNLSKAHGPVSSFCTFSLQYCNESISDAGGSGTSSGSSKREYSRSSSSSSTSADRGGSSGDSKPAAKATASSSQNNGENGSQEASVKARSPVVASNDHPVWENCQFEFPLWKRHGESSQDGQRIVLTVRVEEDATAVEQFLPMFSGTNRLLGVGSLDVTDLCLGEVTGTGQILPGVLDTWIPISLSQQQEHEEEEQQKRNRQKEQILCDPELSLAAATSSSSTSSAGYEDPLAPPKRTPLSDQSRSSSTTTTTFTGMVRVLVSYQPVGLDPQPKDIVALESFARRPTGSNSCRPLLQPLQPLTVLERRGSYLLCEYTLPTASSGHRRRGPPSYQKACVRLHRNAVFVIERKSLMDAAQNLALLPADVWMSTPVGQALADWSAPVLAAGHELLLPAVLSIKLLWMALRTTTVAGWVGAQALGATFLQEGSNSLTRGGGGGGGSNDSNQTAARRRQQQEQQWRNSSEHNGNTSSSDATAQYLHL